MMVGPWFFLKVVVWFMFLTSGSCSGHTSECNQQNRTLCVEALKLYSESQEYWFGDRYSDNCPSDEEYTKQRPECVNPHSEFTTIFSRIFQRNDYNVDELSQPLNIRYYVRKGMYRACDHIFHVGATHMTSNIDHTHLVYLDQWVLAHKPAVTWEAEPDVTYMLVVYDVDRLELCGMRINIRGGDWSLGEELYPYRGPYGAFDRVAVHAFLLFRQKSLQGPAVDTLQKNVHDYIRDNSGRYLLHNMMDSVETLIGLGLIGIKAGPYGVERYREMGIVNNCPLLFNAMKNKLPANPKTLVETYLSDMQYKLTDLTSYVEVAFFTEQINFTSCCFNVSERAQAVYVDPFSTKVIWPVQLRNTPVVRLAAVNMMDSIFYLHKRHTIVLVDVTQTLQDSNTNAIPLLWLVEDVEGQYAMNGNTTFGYVTPSPPLEQEDNSLYFFFVFEQTSDERHGLSSYCNDTSSCANFRLKDYVSDHHLNLSGITWFWSRADLYSSMQMYADDPSNMATACEGVPGYKEPCPDMCGVPLPTPKPTPKPTPRPTPRPTSKPPTGPKDAGDVNQANWLFLTLLACVTSVLLTVGHHS